MPSAVPASREGHGVVFITRLKTPNKGNQGLSSEWIRLLHARVGSGELTLAPRVPDHLLRYNLRALGGPQQAPARFERWVERELRSWSRTQPLPAPPIGEAVILDEQVRNDDAPINVVKRIVNVRARLARIGFYRHSYMQRLSRFKQAGCVILNPAGEFWVTATDIPLRHLLDIYLAKRLGCRTAIVNHTFELVEPTLLAVARLVYSAMDLISVREEKSKTRLVELGIDPARIIVAPDVVFMTEPASRSAHKTGDAPQVAICPNSVYLEKAADVWSPLVERLLAFGARVTLVTNDYPTDHETIDRLMAKFGLEFAGKGASYREYAGLLSGFDAVISSRLHTGIMTLTAGVPVIPVEALQFKITGTMAAAGVPLAAARPDEPGWVDAVMHNLQAVLDDQDAARAWVADVVDRQKRGVDAFFDEVDARLALSPSKGLSD